eukprot:309834_1
MARCKEESLIHRSPTLRIIGDHKLTHACASNHWRSKINIGIPTLRIIGDQKLIPNTVLKFCESSRAITWIRIRRYFKPMTPFKPQHQNSASDDIVQTTVSLPIIHRSDHCTHASNHKVIQIIQFRESSYCEI